MVHFWPRQHRNSTERAHYEWVENAAPDPSKLGEYIFDNSDYLKSTGFTYEMLMAEEEQKAANETVLQLEVTFNETIANETRDKEAAEVAKKKAREEAYEKQKEQEKLQKEEEEAY